MTDHCTCDHSRHYHFMNFGKCRWRQTTPHGDIACDCSIYEAVSENNHDLVRNGRHANANKTHCPKGHPYGYQWAGGCRRCKKECDRKSRGKHG